LHESEHARFFQIREFPAPKFPMAGRARRDHLSTAPPRHPAPGRNFVLHIPFLVLHARYLSRCLTTDALAPRFRSRGFIFPAARGWTNRPSGRFSAATRAPTAFENKPISLGLGADDT